MLLRYADTLNAGAATITPRAIADWGSGIAEASGTYSQFGSGGWSTQGALSASLFAPGSHGFLAELAGVAGGSTHNDGTRTGQILANGRLHFMRESRDLFFGAGGGRTWAGGGSRNVLLGEAGASIALREVGAIFTASPAVVEDSIRYLDSQLSLSWVRDRLDLGALVGHRLGDQLPSLGGTTRSWGNLSAVAWITPGLAVVANGGTFPIDPTQGFPGGRFLSVSIRVATRRAREALSSSARQQQVERSAEEEKPAVTGFLAEAVRAGAVTLRATAPLARLVEISGDFTNWMPVALERAGNGVWSVTLPMDPGNYQMNLRVDGGKWLVPPGLLSMLDEFGGAVGLLVIEANTKM
ncbi:MAG: glycogen-binding domain-containing protein [Gemmatimonadota bacterium]|nr:glycogen-binding domain-containing protein [Gemmatimonadota bacterium]